MAERIPPRAPVNADTWFEFFHEDANVCGLCGKRCRRYARLRRIAARGGVRAFCICPNGRTLKVHLQDELPPEEPKERIH